MSTPISGKLFSANKFENSGFRGQYKDALSSLPPSKQQQIYGLVKKHKGNLNMAMADAYNNRGSLGLSRDQVDKMGKSLGASGYSSAALRDKLAKLNPASKPKTYAAVSPSSGISQGNGSIQGGNISGPSTPSTPQAPAPKLFH